MQVSKLCQGLWSLHWQGWEFQRDILSTYPLSRGIRGTLSDDERRLGGVRGWEVADMHSGWRIAVAECEVNEMISLPLEKGRHLEFLPRSAYSLKRAVVLLQTASVSYSDNR